jgi:pimeloyl-ACP methyl ester carboxylesterase
MGGIVAMEIIRRAPERVDRIALLDTNPKAETEEMRQRREPQIRRILDGDLAGVMREEMKPNYLADGPRRADILDLCMAMAASLGPDVFTQQSRALQTRRDQQQMLRQITVPALVLCGEDDKLCPVERHELMHELIPGSSLDIIAQAGHLTTLEQPDLTNAALRRWLTA